MNSVPTTILIIDYGSQYTQLIARRVREANVFCELIHWETAVSDPDLLASYNPAGFILGGGPNSVYDDGAPTLPTYVLESGKPVLGICYGMQILSHTLGGKVAGSQRREYGQSAVSVESPDNPLFTNIGAELTALMSHGDKVEQLPAGWQPIAHTSNSPYAAASHLEKNIYAVQFHPEVVHTPMGAQLLQNFVHTICGVSANWTSENYIEEQTRLLREQIGDGRVVLGLSGGVDSAVAAALIHRAVGKQLTCVYVDHGMMRQGETAQVVQTFEREQGMKLIAVNAVEEFLADLKGVTEPERKRKIIGEKFVRIFERESDKLGQIDFLAQGTIYPDVIESAAKDRSPAHTIKTHHNVGGLPDDMQFELVEPLRMLFKDEVRKIGTALGLPDSIVHRQPFPGPGLAIRCLGEVNWERLETLRAADAIFTDELRKGDLLKGDTQQAFAALLPVKSVGVMGDMRTYQEVIALRAVTTEDFMTADWARLDYELLARVSLRIVNEVSGVNRVVYDITSKPPGTIEWE